MDYEFEIHYVGDDGEKILITNLTTNLEVTTH
jgi:hypothetical protein